MPKYFTNKIIKKLKKICSQFIWTKNQNESIMVTTRFFTFFPEGEAQKAILDIYKCPKSICDQQV